MLYDTRHPEEKKHTPSEAGGKDVHSKDMVETIEYWKAKADEYLNGWKRAKADYSNLKRDTERERGELIEFANALFIGELLPIIDNFTKALFEAKETEHTGKDGWLAGFGHIVKSFEDILAKRGITAIACMGKEFDPHYHEAVGHEKKEGMNGGMVLREVQTGYLLKDTVLRPSKVIVSE